MLIHLEEAEDGVRTQMERLKRAFPKYQKLDLREPFEVVNRKIGSMAESISQYTSRKQDIIRIARESVELTKQEHKKVQSILQQIDTYVQQQLAAVVRMPHNHQPGDS
jgi:methyl-accepting chemotaxis protein